MLSQLADLIYSAEYIFSSLFQCRRLCMHATNPGSSLHTWYLFSQTAMTELAHLCNHMTDQRREAISIIDSIRQNSCRPFVQIAFLELAFRVKLHFSYYSYPFRTSCLSFVFQFLATWFYWSCRKSLILFSESTYLFLYLFLCHFLLPFLLKVMYIWPTKLIDILLDFFDWYQVKIFFYIVCCKVNWMLWIGICRSCWTLDSTI